jgi:hypothetical protein
MCPDLEPDYRTDDVSFSDGSRVTVHFVQDTAGEMRLHSVDIQPPEPPLTRLRRTFARLFPFLKE